MTNLDFCKAVLCQVALFAKAKGLRLYLVGGFIRDELLGRKQPSGRAAGMTDMPANVDLAISTGALEVAKDLAEELDGTYVCLDQDMATARVVVSSQEQHVELDLSDLRGDTIEEDLARRDFTINAMAVPLDVWCADPKWAESLIDPLDGRRDLQRKRLRACFDQTFIEDPVRILRAFRFAAALDFSLNPQLLPLVASAAPRLANVSGERIRDELFEVFQTNRAGWALRQLSKADALDVLFPELGAGRGVEQGGYHHLDVFDHQLETVAQCDRLMRDFAEFALELRGYMAEHFERALIERRSRKALVKLAALYHDAGKPATKRVEADGDIWFIGHEQFGANLAEGMTERLRLSRREAGIIQRLVLHHLRPGHLSREPQLTPRAIYRFFRDLGDDGPACLALWWADRLATRGAASRLDQIDEQRARVEELLRAYFLKAKEVIKPPRLVDGNQLMAAFGLPSGPVIGQLLRMIEEAQAEGQVHSKEEALRLARDFLTKASSKQ